MNHADDNLDVNRVLRELFQAHGVEAILQGEWTQLPKSGMKASASIIQEITRPTSITAELEVRFEFAPGRTILEAFAGLGATKEATVRDAFGNFVTNSFHVSYRLSSAPRLLSATTNRCLRKNGSSLN